METDLNNRLNEVLIYSRLNVAPFARRCGLHQATFDKQLKGIRGVSVDTLIGIAKAFPEVSTDWLLIGKGEMIRKKNSEEVCELLETVEALNNALSAQANTIKRLNDQIKELEK